MSQLPPAEAEDLLFVNRSTRYSVFNVYRFCRNKSPCATGQNPIPNYLCCR